MKNRLVNAGATMKRWLAIPFENGQSITETALVLPIFLLLVFGVFEFGRIIFVFSAINNASREAARFGAATGLTGDNIPNYLDCDDIRQQAKATGFLAGLEDSDIQIGYDRPDPDTGTMQYFASCEDDLLPGDIEKGDRIVVTVTKSIDPIIPLIPIPTFNPTFVTARTILTDIIIGPLECSDGVDNDGDGFIDEADPGCNGPNDTTEAFCYSLSVVGSPPEGGNLSVAPGANCANRYIEETVVNLGAFPAPLYTFRRWSGDASGTFTTTQVTMDSDKDVVAEFRLLTAELSTVKGDSPDPVLSREELTYNITVNNTFTDTANNLVLTDTWPLTPTEIPLQSHTISHGGSCEFVNDIYFVCSVDSLPAGEILTLEMVVLAPIVDESTTITNTVTVSAIEFDPNLANNTAIAVTTVDPRAELHMIDKVDAEDPVYAGDNIEYTITVVNFGPSLATGVKITDPLPARTQFVSSPDGCNTNADPRVVVCPIGTMNVGVEKSVSFTIRAPNNGELVRNIATVSGNEVENNTGDNSADEYTEVRSRANLSLSKSAPATAFRDVDFDYTITVNNGGPSNVGNVVITDTLPAGVQYNGFSGANSCTPYGNVVICNLGAMPSGNNRVVTLNVTPVVNGNIVNTATVGSDTEDQNPGNNTDSASTLVEAVSSLSLNKISNPLTVQHDDVFEYTLSVSNAGPSNATNVQLTDVLPPEVEYVGADVEIGWSCNIAADTVTCTPDGGLFVAGMSANLIIHVRAVAVGTANNTANLNASEGSASDSASTTIEPDLDLSVDIDGPANGENGVSFDYTVTAANSGPSEANNVSITIDIDSSLTIESVSAGAGWTCTETGQQIVCDLSGSLNAGNTSTLITITVTPSQVGTVTSQAEVTANEMLYDSNSSNNTDSADTDIN